MSLVKLKLIPGLLIIALFLINNIWSGCTPKKSTGDLSNVIETEVVTNPVPLSVDSAAVELLRRGLGTVSSMDMFSVQTQSTYEDLLNKAYRVDYEISGSLSVNRPNEVRIERYGLNIHQIFYYDGMNFTLHNPDDDVYATEPFSGKIEDLFHFVRDTFGISGPSSDLIYINSFALLAQGVNAATVIGKEMIGDFMCDHLFFGKPDVTFQIWISESEPYLPYKYVVTDISTPQLLSSAIVMKNWDTAPDLPESVFNFTPPEGSSKILLLKVGPNKKQ